MRTQKLLKSFRFHGQICELWCWKLNELKRADVCYVDRRPSHMLIERFWKHFFSWRWWNSLKFQTITVEEIKNPSKVFSRCQLNSLTQTDEIHLFVNLQSQNISLQQHRCLPRTLFTSKPDQLLSTLSLSLHDETYELCGSTFTHRRNSCRWYGLWFWNFWSLITHFSCVFKLPIKFIRRVTKSI